MLKRIKFDVTFPTGKHIVQDLEFDQGTTAITGRNGMGKSTILEMASYALFGIDAARGKSDDYKKCSVDLTFVAKGAPYRIERTNGSKATLWDAEGNPLATGTTAVNSKVVEILGYGLPVFSVANHIGQGEIEALMAMKPSERKRLVDSTIGLDALDVVAEWALGEASLARKEADTVQGLLRQPEKPQEPGNYRPSTEVLVDLEKVTAARSERDQLRGWLSRPGPGLPTQPVDPAPSKTVEELHQEVQVYTSLALKLQRLQQLPEAQFTSKQLDEMEEAIKAWKAWDSYQTQLGRMPEKPMMTQDEVDQHRATWEAIKAWDAAAAHRLTCPKCEHEFTSDGKTLGPRPEVPPSVEELNREQEALRAWANPPQEVPQAEEPQVTLEQISQWRRAAATADERDLLIQETQGFDPSQDPTPVYKNKVAYDAASQVYARQLQIYEAYEAEKAIKVTRLGELTGVDVQFVALNDEKNTALLYERQLLGYETALAEYERLLAQVEAAKHRADQYKASAAAMRELKTRVKSFLVPSLNKVASHLVQQMTVGQPQEISSVEVSEDFDITVDGQPIETLNGSGKTVANLAVRIGLGQILTNRVFSLLMADEVDAACDEDRAAAIALCLQNLTNNIHQVLIVSHKDIEADHIVSL